ncbi:MAG TPA: type II toxin-antitoxin system RelE/ParE family toxin [Allosphingosinicella sp.]|nr:type II toxin-antitoxin system RelE/ParE family toxin [Allosphingosinicella sp.]
MTRSVTYRPFARDDLKQIYDWLTPAAGPEVALGLVEAIEERCDRLGVSSTGRPRPEIGPGIMSIPFRKRGVIAYRIVEDEVEIIGILYGGRDVSVLSEPGRQD